VKILKLIVMDVNVNRFVVRFLISSQDKQGVFAKWCRLEFRHGHLPNSCSYRNNWTMPT
jgi:hypothetical protein